VAVAIAGYAILLAALRVSGKQRQQQGSLY
jgi:hypothetical protein